MKHLCLSCQYIYPECPCDNNSKVVFACDLGCSPKDDRIIECDEYKERKDVVALEEQLKEAIEVIEFYADKSNWKKQNQTSYTITNQLDMDRSKIFSFGGKKARDFLKKIKDNE